jgi:hypothetical protein
VSTRVRPLIARPGARFACAGDGLCCTDLHALGPLSRSEAKSLRVLVPGSVQFHQDIEAPCMRPGADGACAQLGKRGCGIHARFGADEKPVGCSRFPYGLVGTPSGGRVTTLGTRPPLDLADAERSLRDVSGRLETDAHAPARVPMARRARLPFARYAAIEVAMLARLAAGDRIESVLAAKPFPKLARSSWPPAARPGRT